MFQHSKVWTTRASEAASGPLRDAAEPRRASPSLAKAMGDCADTPGWENHSGKKCHDYVTERWCVGKHFTVGKEWTSGAQFNFPERHCCACGKPASVEDDPEVQALTKADVRPDVRAVIDARTASCKRFDSRTAAPLVQYLRLPRVGNALMCALLSACSGSQSRTACGGGEPVGAGACPGGASPAYSQHGNFRLASSSLGMCAGPNGTSAQCSSGGGDETLVCGGLQTLRLPGSVLVQYEHFVELEKPPCAWAAPPVRLITLLRDPGERAQSAYTFGLEACVCNFRFPWCALLT